MPGTNRFVRAEYAAYSSPNCSAIIRDPRVHGQPRLSVAPLTLEHCGKSHTLPQPQRDVQWPLGLVQQRQQSISNQKREDDAQTSAKALEEHRLG
jgi:hypothetical protein